MKQYTTPEQTTKLIELGFDRPKFEIETQLCNIEGQPLRVATIVGDYSIGELIEILPQTINVYYDLSIMRSCIGWWVLYGMIGDGDMWSIEHEVYRNELIDALYDMCVLLKEEGVI